MARRHIDQEAIDLAVGHGFKMFADGVDMPVADELPRLDEAPRRGDEVGKRIFIAHGVGALANGERALPISPNGTGKCVCFHDLIWADITAA